MVALLQLMPKELAAVCDAAEKDSRGFCEIERAVIGVDHEQLGAALSAAWGFPASCQSAASYHDRPAESDAENRLIVEMVHVADTLCCGERIGFSLTAHRQSVPPMLATRFGLDTDAWDSTQQRVAALAYAATTIFG